MLIHAAASPNLLPRAREARLGRWQALVCRTGRENIWTAVCVYVLAAIIKRELALNVSLNTFLQILSVHSFEKIELFRAFQEIDNENLSPRSNNQLNLFDS